MASYLSSYSSYFEKASGGVSSMFDSLQSSEAHFFDEDKYNDTEIRRWLN